MHHQKKQASLFTPYQDDHLFCQPLARFQTPYHHHDLRHPNHHIQDKNPHQEANRNYEEYLAAIGTGPCSQDMVMRADVKLTIEQVLMMMILLLMMTVMLIRF